MEQYIIPSLHDLWFWYHGTAQPAFTFSCICAVHSEVCWLTCFQASSLHTRSKHFDFLRMTPLTYEDLHKSTRVRITHLCRTWDHSQVRALLGEELQDNRCKWMATNLPGCRWADRRPPCELVKTEIFIQADRFLKKWSRRAHLLEVHRRVLSS